ncbi:zinc-regulated GTPase metalloprotein activator 1A-like isoform X2 [Corticium candelabrum]|uniref:zinc-regulated GTPase metalloprotein activator 1A-like isoform X2 n=1 Tax=Corticium candelabrum TaxID=121492 RepID=UPI002E2530D8|nr:zinc-regulated GTPase metalloprotein activator 1A-like isoform X2 [Corticium candelabrum]
MKKKGRFDYIVLETTGLADPGPIAAMFWLDEGLGSELYIDGIVTLVDAKHGLQCLQLAKPGIINEAVRQVAVADTIVINKLDLVSPDQLRSIRQHIQTINGFANLVETERAWYVSHKWQSKRRIFLCQCLLTLIDLFSLDLALVFDLNAYDCNNAKNIGVLSERIGQSITDPKHNMDTSVNSIDFQVKGDVDELKFDDWLQGLLWDKKYSVSGVSYEVSVLRLKGVISMKGYLRRVVVQAVYDVFDKQLSTNWESPEEQQNHLVVIGSVVA